jgi:hypothetical protein
MLRIDLSQRTEHIYLNAFRVASTRDAVALFDCGDLTIDETVFILMQKFDFNTKEAAEEFVANMKRA